VLLVTQLLHCCSGGQKLRSQPGGGPTTLEQNAVQRLCCCSRMYCLGTAWILCGSGRVLLLLRGPADRSQHDKPESAILLIDSNNGCT
jgi:hypothetical protein